MLFCEKAVNKLLIENRDNASTIGKDKVALNTLERLNSNEMIEKSDVFVSIDGVLKAVVKQKTPVAQVLDRYGSFTLIMRRYNAIVK
jgi:cell division protein FtsQ